MSSFVIVESPKWAEEREEERNWKYKTKKKESMMVEDVVH